MPTLRATQITHSLLLGGTILVASLTTGCREPDPGPTPARPEIGIEETRYGLDFEERMAIPPQITRLRAESTRRADAVYDPYRSRENAMRNEAYRQELLEDAVNRFLEEKELTHEDLDVITREYQASLGAILR